MRLDKFTVKAQEAVARSQELAQQRDHSEISPLHVLAALLAEESLSLPTNCRLEQDGDNENVKCRVTKDALTQNA